MAEQVFEMIFDVIGTVISVMKSVTFLGVSIFYWSIGFLVMSAVIAYLINTANSPYVESHTHEVARKERALRKSRRKKG